MINIPSYDDFQRIDEVVNYDESYGRGKGVTEHPMVNEVDSWIMGELGPNPITFKRICWREDVTYATPFGLKFNISIDEKSGKLSIRWFQEPHSPAAASLTSGNFLADNSHDAITKLSKHPFYKGFKKSLVADKVTKSIVLSKLRSKLSARSFVEYLKAVGPTDLKDRSNELNYKTFGAKSGTSNYYYGYDLTLAIERGWEIDVEWIEANKKEIVAGLGIEYSNEYGTSKLVGFGYDEGKRMLWYQSRTDHYYD